MSVRAVHVPEVTVVCKLRLFVVLLELVSLVLIGRPAMAQASPPVSPPVTWTLEDVLKAALAQHPLVDAARAQVSAVEGRRTTVTTFPNPVATLWTENMRFPGQGPLTHLDQETSFYATLPLEPFVQRGSRLEQIDDDLRAAQATVTRAERDIALDAAHAFYRVALAQATVDAVRENRAAVDQLVAYLRTRVAQGANPEAELIRAEVERDHVESDVTLAEVELLRAQGALRVFLGNSAPSMATLRVTSLEAATEAVPLAPLSNFTTHALQARPDLLVGRAQVGAATGGVAVERSFLARQLGATLGLKRTAGTNGMVAGMTVTLPLFDQNKGEIQRATGERLAAEAQLHWLERTVTSELEGAYEAAALLTARIAAVQPTALGRAEESRRIAVAAYQEGAATLLQVIDAARALTETRLSLVRLATMADESLFELGVAAGYDPAEAASLTHRVSPTVKSNAPGGLR